MRLIQGFVFAIALLAASKAAASPAPAIQKRLTNVLACRSPDHKYDYSELNGAPFQTLFNRESVNALAAPFNFNQTPKHPLYLFGGRIKNVSVSTGTSSENLSSLEIVGDYRKVMHNAVAFYGRKSKKLPWNNAEPEDGWTWVNSAGQSIEARMQKGDGGEIGFRCLINFGNYPRRMH